MSLAGKHDAFALAIPNQYRKKFYSLLVPQGDCEIYSGMLATNGYGIFECFGRKIGAHRLALLWALNKEAEGSVTRHKCRNKACCAVKHLTFGTYKENAADRRRDGTHLLVGRGERSARAKMTEDMVIKICEMYFVLELPPKKICDNLGQSLRSIRSVVHRAAWRQVSDKYVGGQSALSSKVKREKISQKAKLSTEQVIDVADMIISGAGRALIASKFGVSHDVITQIKFGHNYKKALVGHVEFQRWLALRKSERGY